MSQHCFEFQLVWQNLSETLKQEVTQFWVTEGALPNAQAAQARLPQLMYLVRDQTGKLIAASSVFEQYNEQLKNHFYYMRAFITPPYRDSELGQELVVKIRDYFNESFKAGKQTKNIGLMTEVVDKEQQKKYNDAIWGKSGMVYVGKTSSSAQQRVFYFTDARII